MTSFAQDNLGAQEDTKDNVRLFLNRTKRRLYKPVLNSLENLEIAKKAFLL